MTDIPLISRNLGPDPGEINRLVASVNSKFTELSSSITGVVAQTITNGVTTSAPSQDAVYDALALKEDASAVAADARAACVAQTITNGVTTSAPSQDAVFDALALKQDASGTAAAAVAAVVTQVITNGVTGKSPSEDAVFDALALKQPLDTQLTSVAGLAYASNALKVMRVNAGETDFELATPSGGATDIDGLSDAITNYTLHNVFLGQTCGDSITSGSENTGLGQDALTACTSGADNVAIGYQAGNAITDGSNNITIGADAGGNISQGAVNVAIGSSAANTLTTGTGNICIGALSNVSAAGSTNRIVVGYNTSNTVDNTFVMGPIGTKQLIKEGANAAMGLATLSGGTVVVSNTLVTANSRIFLTAQSLGTITVPVGYAISARSAGTSFTILSGNVADTSTIAWEIKEPG